MLRETFLGMLMEDVITARKQTRIDDSQAARRVLIRALFAAIEGLVWQYREHVRSVASSLDELPPLMELALTETAYTVTESGKLVEQTRHIPLTTMIKLTTKFAERLSPKLKVDFSGTGWSDFQTALAVRHSITHPKAKSDLEISPAQLEAAWSGYFWLVELTTLAMAETLASSAAYLAEFKTIIRQLRDGDPATLKAYRAALSADD